MSCFPCFSSGSKKPRSGGAVAPSRSLPRAASRKEDAAARSPEDARPKSPAEPAAQNDTGNGNIAAQSFTFRELAAITNNFRPECLLGEGGFGRVYKGRLENNGQLVAVKQMDRNGFQGNQEFLVEVLMLSLLHHPNLVNLIGYCADGDQRLLVYEFMALGSLEDHLFDTRPDQKPLDWYTRMRIATGAASGLEYLHEKANPPVIYRDLKSSNILLDEGFCPKLSDFGLAKLGPSVGDKLNNSSRVMGTYGYCAPEYARSGQLTLKSDVYSFGVVLLELITGKRVIDTTRPTDAQNLVAWALPMFKDQKRFSELVDPLLDSNYPTTGLNQAVAVAAMCLQEEPTVRPLMADVVTALSFLMVAPPDSGGSSTPPRAEAPPPREVVDLDQAKQESDEESQRSATETTERGVSPGGKQQPRIEDSCPEEEVQS